MGSELEGPQAGAASQGVTPITHIFSLSVPTALSKAGASTRLNAEGCGSMLDFSKTCKKLQKYLEGN